MQRYLRFLLPVATIVLAAAPPNNTAEPDAIANVNCETISLSHIDADSAEFEVTLTGTATKSLTVNNLFFDRVTVDGIPLRLSPVRGPFRLVKGKPIDTLPTLSASVAFQELPSLDPLKTMVSRETAHVKGSLLAELDLNLIEMLALRARGLWVSTKLNQQVPVSLPGGQFGKLAALAALTAAEPVWQLGNAGREWRAQRDDFRTTAEGALRRSLVSIETSFTVRPSGREGQPLSAHAIGFVVPGGRILTVQEAIQPWLYSPELARSLSKHQAVVESDSIETRIRPVEASSDYSSRRGEFRIIETPSKTTRMMWPDKASFYRMALRNTPENTALLELQNVDRAPPAVSLDHDEDAVDWQPAAIFRFYDASHLAISITEAKQVDGRYLLRDAIPDAAGSPVWMNSGVVAILQDDTSAAPISGTLKSFL